MTSHLPSTVSCQNFSLGAALELGVAVLAVVVSAVLAVKESFMRVYCGIVVGLFIVYCLRLWRLLPAEKQWMLQESYTLADKILRKQQLPNTQ